MKLSKSVAELQRVTDAFVKSIMQFGLDDQIDLVRFKKGQRKDDVMQARLQAFKKKHQKGVVFIGVAQEKARVPRTVRKAFGNSTIPWIDYSSANVNFYYFYCLDETSDRSLSSSAPIFPIRPSFVSMATSI